MPDLDELLRCHDELRAEVIIAGTLAGCRTNRAVGYSVTISGARGVRSNPHGVLAARSDPPFFPIPLESRGGDSKSRAARITAKERLAAPARSIGTRGLSNDLLSLRLVVPLGFHLKRQIPIH